MVLCKPFSSSIWDVMYISSPENNGAGMFLLGNKLMTGMVLWVFLHHDAFVSKYTVLRHIHYIRWFAKYLKK